MRRAFLLLVLPLALFPDTPLFALGFGAIGDSLTDEYLGNSTSPQFAETDLPAKNWVQILVEKRGLGFGAFQSDGSVRGEPRLEGYAYNYARSGATAKPGGIIPVLGLPGAVAQANLLAPHVTSGDVDIVFLGLGANDFTRAAIEGAPTDAAFQAALVADIMSAVDVLEAAGTVSVVIDLIPNTSAAGVATNVLLANSAAARGLGVMSLFGFLIRPGDPHFDSVTNLITVGGVQFAVGSAGDLADAVPIAMAGPGAPCDSMGNCGTLAYASAHLSHDGIHPSTIVQGLMANEFLMHINANLGVGIPLLTDAEILMAVPEPGIAPLVVFGLLALHVAHRRTR